MTQVTTQDPLFRVLEGFHARVQGSAPVKRLLERWDRLVELRVEGAAGRSFFLRSRSGVMLAPTRESEGAADIVIAAREEVLVAIFQGELNPARAHLDGELLAYGSQKDQLVLDSIVLLVWGY